MDRQADGIIEKFAGEHFFLSNFYPASVWIDGVKYPTAEHAIQAHKSHDHVVRATIAAAKTPWEAKRLGRCVLLREDWDTVKEETMIRILRAKFENPFLQHMLLMTSPKKLVHGNTWNDRHWGMCRGVGKNVLGELLERLREELSSVET